MATKNVYIYIATLIISLVVVIFMIQYLWKIGHEENPHVSTDVPSSSMERAAQAIPITPAIRDRAADQGSTPPKKTEKKADRPAKSPEKRITVYVTRWCTYCRKTTQLLDSLGVRYTVKDIEKDRKANSEMLRMTRGRPGVPVVDIDGTVIHGYNPFAIKKALDK